MEHSTRVNLACEECRRRKRKCDGSQPVCSPCAAQDRSCIYIPERQSRKRKREEYIQRLEEQVQRLGAKLRDQEDVPRLPVNDHHTALDSNPEDQNISVDIVSSAETRLASAVDEVGSILFKFRIGDSGDTSFIGPSTNFHLSSSAISQKVPNLGGTDVPESPSAVDRYLRDHDLQDVLMTIFTRDLNPQHHFLRDKDLAAINSRSDLTDGTPRALLKTAIFAASSCLYSGKDADIAGEAFGQFAEGMVQQCCRRFPCLTIVQALTILCWKDLTLDTDSMAWMYNCMASGLATHLGLHVISMQNPDGLTFDDEESRLQTFWQCFRFDRIATFSLGRQCVIPWRRVRTPYPLAASKEPVSLSRLAFDHECRLLMTFDKYMDQIYSFEFYELEQATRLKLLLEARERLLGFYSEIDARLRHPERIDCSKVYTFHMFCHMCLVLVQRPLLRETPKDSSCHLAVRTMTASAIAITDLVRRYGKVADLEKAPFFLAHHILTAAIVHLLGATSTDRGIRRSSVYRFRICIESLEQMRTSQPRARKAIALLQELAHRWSAVFALPLRLSYPLEASRTCQPTGQTEAGGPIHRILVPSPPATTGIPAMPAPSEDYEFLACSQEAVPDTDLPSFQCEEDIALDFTIWDQGDPFGGNDLDWLIDPPSYSL